VDDNEIKFGYAVTGTVHPDRYWANSTARPGGVLVFTKRLGTGVIATALKRGIADPAHVAASIESMLALNAAAAAALADLEVHACTDITGFGLIGHAREMARASGVTVEIDSGCLRFLPGALDYARQGAIPGGLKNNRDFAAPDADVASAIDPALADLLYDPQTSGGLLVALPEPAAAEFLRRFPAAYAVGRVLSAGEKAVRVL
jgi:selenide,water dikinase